MSIENFLVYRIGPGDNTYPHSGNFRISVAGTVQVDDSNGVEDPLFGDLTHTGGSDVPDQNVVASSVTGISNGDTIDLRYKYTYTGNDGSSGTIHFIATNGAANYGPLIVSDTPLTPGVRYTFGSFNTDGAAPYDALVPCFAAGTVIQTDRGEVVIEDLKTGMMVRTVDAGFQPIRWIGSTSLDAVDLAARPELRPIRIGRGALGQNIPHRDLLVSPQHRILVRSRIAMRMFSAEEVLLPAKKLLGMDGVCRVDDAAQVDYFHILFDAHHLIFSDGAVSESFFVGPQVLHGIDRQSYDEILTLFPEFKEDQSGLRLARPTPQTGRLADKLIYRHSKNGKPLQSDLEIVPA